MEIVKGDVSIQFTRRYTSLISRTYSYNCAGNITFACAIFNDYVYGLAELSDVMVLLLMMCSHCLDYRMQPRPEERLKALFHIYQLGILPLFFHTPQHNSS